MVDLRNTSLESWMGLRWPSEQSSLTETLYIASTDRPLAHMSANAHIESYCLHECQPITKYLWRTCDFALAFEDYSGSKNKTDGGENVGKDTSPLLNEISLIFYS